METFANADHLNRVSRMDYSDESRRRRNGPERQKL